MKITALGYVSLNVSDMPAWLDFVTKVFGMQVLPRDNGVVDLRIDEHHHRFTLQPAEQDSVAAIGWECASKEDIVALQARLEQAGVATAVGSAEDCAERKVRDLVSFNDPFSDIRFELFHSPQSEAFPFLASKGIDGFKTG
ncbi:MAG: VOC family protein, partial [Pseudomonadota bacterium]